jgi:DNA repair exonuclease SbcCD ATPase subunit
MSDQQIKMNKEIYERLKGLESSMKSIVSTLAELKEGIKDIRESTSENYEQLEERVRTNEKDIISLRSCTKQIATHEAEIDKLKIQIARWGAIAATVITVVNFLLDKFI